MEDRGDVVSVVYDFYRANIHDDNKWKERAQATLITKLLSKGWQRGFISQFNKALSAAMSESDVERLLAHYHLSEGMRENKYAMQLQIPLVDKANRQRSLKELVEKLKSIGCKIQKIKIGVGGSFEYDAAEGEAEVENEVSNIIVRLVVYCPENIDRRYLMKQLQPEYKIDKMSYGEREGM